MSSLSAGARVVRRNFHDVRAAVPVPNLIEIQSRSFNEFAQLDVLPSERKNVGLERVFRDIFPIEYNDRMSLEYVSYELGQWSCTCGKLTGIAQRYNWKCGACGVAGCSRLPHSNACPECGEERAEYNSCSVCHARVGLSMPLTLEECRVSGQTFSLPLKVKLQLVSWDKTEEGEKVIRDIKEQEIYFADVPVMANVYEKDDQFLLGSLGTFLINGIDRVIVSQLHRSPGVVFSHSKKVKDVQGKPYYLARIIPMRGSWVDFEFDSYNVLQVRIDKKKKLPVTTLLQALGIHRDELLDLFYRQDKLVVHKESFILPLTGARSDIRIERGMLPVVEEREYRGKTLTSDVLEGLAAAGITHLHYRKEMLLQRVFAANVVHPETGELLVEKGSIFSAYHFDILSGIEGLEISLIETSGLVLQPTLVTTLAQDKIKTQDEALREVYYKISPGDSASLKEIQEYINNIFFNPRLYDLTRVGRIRMNRKLGISVDTNITTLTVEDIIATVKYLIALREREEGQIDDIDHLGNRRVRLVGELLANQMYLGMLRIDRIVRERFRMQDTNSSLAPQDLLNVKPMAAVLREFFGGGQLSQFMDQTNPLAEIAHKRRLSALGPGGVQKDRATYEIRDVHTSHYGRICPVETPEGASIGLISSLATYAMVNDLGFIEAPYRPVKNGVVEDKAIFLDAFEEMDANIAQAESLDPHSHTFTQKSVFARRAGDFVYVDTDKINYVDLSSKQLVSVSTALIPFLEHDDASRALMGANMQRQAVPLVRPQAPLVGTGMEQEIAHGSGACIAARRGGKVVYVSSEKIVVQADESEFRTLREWINNGVDLYYLKKFQRSSYSTWIHQHPAVKVGQRVEAGELITSGTSVVQGEISLGSNLLVAFLPWRGYNFEDAIVLSQRLVSEDVMTSVHIDEYVVEARDTKLGPEEITRDIPNVSEAALAGLDADGVVQIGTRVKAGDILVGKVTLKGDVQYSPEEKLLRAIFGEKSREVRDTSLRMPPGTEGTVVDVKVFSRSGVRKDVRYKNYVAKETERLNEDFTYHVNLVEKMAYKKLLELLDGQEPATKKPLGVEKNVYTKKALATLTYAQISGERPTDKKLSAQIDDLIRNADTKIRVLKKLQEERIARLRKGDPLPSGVIKTIKIYVATKRHIQPGDKMAGRHGNKGVVSLIVPREDMPFLQDGTPVDIVLNPLGVPSRMNVGQILETALGFAGRLLGERIHTALDSSYELVKKELVVGYGQQFVEHYEKTYGKEGVLELARTAAKNGVAFTIPVFESPNYEKEIVPILEHLGVPASGSMRIRDGRTGEYYDQPVTVGTMYVMKLNHMVDDKLHARSVGPYSLVTQQPLGGKSQMGGQRFGEMEVWALEAYGAAYALQELLTYKSDDVTGRHKVYEAIVRGDDVPEPGLPESFNVLIKELQSLGLQIDLFKSGKEDVSG